MSMSRILTARCGGTQTRCRALRFRRMVSGSCPEATTRQSGCGIHTLLLNRHALSARRIRRLNVFFSIIVLGMLRENSRLSSKHVKINFLDCGVSLWEVGVSYSLHVLVQVMGVFLGQEREAVGRRDRQGAIDDDRSFRHSVKRCVFGGWSVGHVRKLRQDNPVVGYTRCCSIDTRSVLGVSDG